MSLYKAESTTDLVRILVVCVAHPVVLESMLCAVRFTWSKHVHSRTLAKLNAVMIVESVFIM